MGRLGEFIWFGANKLTQRKKPDEQNYCHTAKLGGLFSRKRSIACIEVSGFVLFTDPGTFQKHCVQVIEMFAGHWQMFDECTVGKPLRIVEDWLLDTGRPSLVSISHRETPPNMLRFLHLIDQCHGIILNGDAALPLRIRE